MVMVEDDGSSELIYDGLRDIEGGMSVMMKKIIILLKRTTYMKSREAQLLNGKEPIQGMSLVT